MPQVSNFRTIFGRFTDETGLLAVCGWWQMVRYIGTCLDTSYQTFTEHVAATIVSVSSHYQVLTAVCIGREERYAWEVETYLIVMKIHSR